MQDFLSAHKPLIQRLARKYAREHGESVSSENIARELELELSQMEWVHSISIESVASPILYIRQIMRHAAGRAKRRNTLVQQVGAGDDLEVMSQRLNELDADLPLPPPLEPSPEAVRRREQLTAVLSTLPTRVALIGTMWAEDRSTAPEIATVLSLPEAEVEVAIELTKAAANDLHSPPSSSPASGPKQETREQELRDFAMRAADATLVGSHLSAETSARVHTGEEESEDAEAAIVHLTGCPLCRAKLAQGATATRSVVVLAIEAPRSSARDLERAAGAANARLFERGSGRWTAVVDANQASALADELEKGPDSSLISRLAMAPPLDVTTGANRGTIPPKKVSSDSVLPQGTGTDAAELEAWALVARKPQQYVQASFSLGWLLFVAITTTAAAAFAYYHATR